MNIFHKEALQGMRKNRTRTIVTIVGVVLASALIAAVTAFGISLLTYLEKGAEKKYGDWHVEFTDADAGFWQEQGQDGRVEKTAAFENVGYAALAGGQNPDKPYLFIAGFNEGAFQALPLNLVSGRLPENSSELLIPEHVASNGGVTFSVGDTLQLSLGSRRSGDRNLSQHDPYTDDEALVIGEAKTYTVVGIYQRPSFEERTAPGYTAVTAAEEENGFANCSVFVTMKNPFQISAYVKEVSPGHGYALNDEVLRFMGLSSDRLFTTLLGAMSAIVIFIVMIGSVFLICNAFQISLNERTHQFGILMSVGATEKQLRNSVLFEGLIVGIAGIPAGILLGLGGMELVLRIVNQNFKNIMYDTVSLTLIISPPAIAAAALVSLVTILISAWIPARKAAAVPIMECIRQTNEIKVEKKDMKISALSKRLYGLEGELALKNFKRNKGKYRSIVLSLVLSVVLFVSTNAFVIDLKQISGVEVVTLETDPSLNAQALRMFEEMNNMVFIVNVFANTFVIMISLIAAANVFNTISTNIKLRRRELAMLRSLGMSDREFQKMMNFECVFYGMRALLWGIPASILCSWLIYRGLSAGGADKVTFVLPWGSMLASAAGVLCLVFVTMLYATSKIKKENIIDALRDDLI